MDLLTEALQHFTEAYARAAACGLKEPTAMTLATASRDGRPAVRMVLLKGFNRDGFVFFTNYESRKGTHLKENPHAALGFYWPPLEEQATIEGDTHPVTNEEADAYWASRPRESQIGAWASQQSRPLENRLALEKRYQEFEKKFSGSPIPRPPQWSGFRLVPNRIEFWKAGAHRLHTRTVYSRDGNAWSKTLLNP